MQDFQGLSVIIFRNGGNIIGGSREIGLWPNGEGNVFIRSGAIALNGPTVSDNIIVGNNVGVMADGITPAGNADGIMLREYTTRNVIGIDKTEYRNIICVNSNNGISSMNSAYGNLIDGNYVGTDITGKVGLGNDNNGISFEICGFGSIARNNVSCANGREGV